MDPRDLQIQRLQKQVAELEARTLYFAAVLDMILQKYPVEDINAGGLEAILSNDMLDKEGNS